ncbi:MAG TPA: hypothetical protein VFK05_29840 [Polyangiaceae bacterium]|nr:hypothetical protein [Polyangiaceae bacterium]
MSLTEARAATPVALAYDAAPGCPSEMDFKAAVEARDGHFTGERAPGSAWALRVSIVADAGGYRGTLQSTTEEATSAVREVHGATCAEVVDALAVVSATALNPRADANAAVNEPPAPASPPSAKPTDKPSAPPSAAAAEPRLRATGSVQNAKVQVEAGTLRFDKARTLSLFAGAELGLLPHTLMPRYDLSISSANFVTIPSGKSFMDGAVGKLHLSYLGPSTVRTDDASSKVQAFLFGLAVCWSPVYDTRGWAVFLCGEYGAGAAKIVSKDAQGKKIQDKATGLGFAALGFETQYNFASIFQVGLKLGLDAFVNSFSAERPNGSTIFESSQIAGHGMLGLGVQY